MINTYGQLPKALDTSASVKPEKSIRPTASDPVSITGKLIYGTNKKSAEIVIEADILDGWHIYAYLPQGSPYILAEPLLELPEGAKSDTKGWESSAGLPYPGFDNIFIYEDMVTFKINITDIKPGTVIRCGLYYQTCNDKKCLQPQKKMIELKS